VTPGPLVLFGAYLHLTPLEFKEKKNKAEEGEETNSALHTVSRQPGSCFIFFRVDFVLQVAGSHEPQK